MSDAAADAEDLLARLQGSSAPESVALRTRVEAAIDDMKAQLRSRLRASATVSAGEDMTFDVPPAAGLTIFGIGAAALVVALLAVRSTGRRPRRFR
jgi:hypothetical protein